MKKVIAALLTLTMMTGLVACGAKKETPADSSSETKEVSGKEDKEKAGTEALTDEEINLEIWWQSGNVGDPSLSEDEWWITQAIAAFEEANPNINVELTVPSGQVEVTQTYKAAYVAGTEPDIVNLWSGTNLFAIGDLMIDHAPYVSEDDLANITSFSECYENFDATEKLLGVPLVEAGKNVCSFYYNKNILKEAGIDIEAEPVETIADFEAMLQKIQDAGYQPITCDDEGYGVLFCSMGIWWANAVGSEGMYSDSIGETTFADDEAFRGVLTMANEWYNKGYINEDYVSCTESLNNFLTGKAALFSAGTWYLQDIADGLGAENVGMFPMCPWSSNDKYQFASMGGNGQVLCISAQSEHPAEAAALIAFLNSKEQTEAAQKQHLVLPARADVDYPVSGGLYDDVVAAVDDSVFYYDNTLRADVVTEFYRLWPLVVTGTTSVDEAITTLDSLVASGE